MSKHLYPCLWFDGRIAEATHYYCSLFEHSKIHAENNIITKFELEGTVLKLLNGGAIFSKNPSISLFVKCATKAEVEQLGSALMGNPATAEKARNAFMKMKKLIIKYLY